MNKAEEKLVWELISALAKRVTVLEDSIKTPPATPMTTENSYYMGNGVWARFKP